MKQSRALDSQEYEDTRGKLSQAQGSTSGSARPYIQEGNKKGKDKKCQTYVRVRVRAGMTLTGRGRKKRKKLRSLRSEEA